MSNRRKRTSLTTSSSSSSIHQNNVQSIPGSPRSARQQKNMKEPAEVVTGAIYQDLLEDLAMEVIYDVHREHRLSFVNTSATSSSNNNNNNLKGMKQMFVDKPGFDIYGNKPEPNGVDDVCECMNCKRRFPSQRFANHMEKCLGMGRQRRQAATRSRLSFSSNSQQPAASNLAVNPKNSRPRLSDSDVEALLSSDNDDELSSLSDDFQDPLVHDSEDADFSITASVGGGGGNAGSVKRKRKKQ